MGTGTGAGAALSDSSDPKDIIQKLWEEFLQVAFLINLNKVIIKSTNFRRKEARHPPSQSLSTSVLLKMMSATISLTRSSATGDKDDDDNDDDDEDDDDDDEDID